jgi:hypothetical protein
MIQPLQTIQTFVAPVVVISANGLLCLAFYNRLTAVVSRMRTINKERFDLSTRLSARSDQSPDAMAAAHLRRRVEVLDELGHELLGRVRLVRDSLVYLLAAVLCMLASSLALGLTPLHPAFGSIALALFVVGIAVMMVGVLKSIQELRTALITLQFEHEMLEKTPEDQPGEIEIR